MAAADVGEQPQPRGGMREGTERGREGKEKEEARREEEQQQGQDNQ